MKLFRILFSPRCVVRSFPISEFDPIRRFFQEGWISNNCDLIFNSSRKSRVVGILFVDFSSLPDFDLLLGGHFDLFRIFARKDYAKLFPFPSSRVSLFLFDIPRTRALSSPSFIIIIFLHVGIAI